jgi:hypothetical protein
MRRIDEIVQPDSCINKARNNEMVFVLIGRDAAAPEAIRAWVKARIKLKKNTKDDYQIKEALACAEIMEKERNGTSLVPSFSWREIHDPK